MMQGYDLLALVPVFDRRILGIKVEHIHLDVFDLALIDGDANQGRRK